MNTALLTGIPHSVPVKLVVVETGGAVSEVTEQMGCESSNKQVLQVRTRHASPNGTLPSLCLQFPK